MHYLLPLTQANLFTPFLGKPLQQAVFFCYSFLQDNEHFLLPVISNRYCINIKDNFSDIKSSQTQRNPFKQALGIHYSIPTNIYFCVGWWAEGIVKERKIVKDEYNQLRQKGSSDDGYSSASEKSVLKTHLDKLQALRVCIEFDLVEKLASELPGKWILRNLSHISRDIKPK